MIPQDKGLVLQDCPLLPDFRHQSDTQLVICASDQQVSHHPLLQANCKPRCYLQFIKKHEILPFSTPWMDLENIILTEVKTNVI